MFICLYNRNALSGWNALLSLKKKIRIEKSKQRRSCLLTGLATKHLGWDPELNSCSNRGAIIRGADDSAPIFFLD